VDLPSDLVFRSALFVPPALIEGEDDALVDGAAFQLVVGLGGLLHGHGLVRAQAEPAYTLSRASLSGPARPGGSPPKNRRRTRSTCPGAASCRACRPRAVRVTSVTRLSAADRPHVTRPRALIRRT
jgi:hypothetical protein